MPKQKRIILIILFCALVDITFSQTSNACSCSAMIEDLVEKISVNHIGYHIEVKNKREAEFSRHVKHFQERSRRTTIENCVPLLKEFIKFFKDGHLYIGQNPRLSDELKNELLRDAEKILKSESEIRKSLERRGRRLEEIEDVWYAKDGSRFAIIRDEQSNERDFVAIYLSGPGDRWQAGHVKAEFRKLKDGSYEVRYYNDDHYPLYPGTYHRGWLGGAVVQRGHILHMAPVSWGRSYPLKRNDLNIIDRNDPRRPTLKFTDRSTAVFFIPSHAPEYAPILKELVDKNHEKIIQTDTLIIDLRGNEGGSSWMTNVLMPYIETSLKRDDRYWIGDHDLVLSSPWNIRYFKNVESQGWLPKQLIIRMEQNPGKLVPFSDPVSETVANAPVAEVKELPKPRDVAVLMDRSVVSAAEAFIIKTMKNRKVTLFGENSGGVIDYRSTSGVSLSGCSEMGVFLGYPMLAASGRLPDGGVNRTGIPPDVRIDEKDGDPIRFIIRHLNQGRNNPLNSKKLL